MARTSKIKFNIEDLFIEGQHDAATKQKIITCSLFPIAATMYNTAEKQLRIGTVTFNGDGSVGALNLVSPLGMNIARLTAAGQQITAYLGTTLTVILARFCCHQSIPSTCKPNLDKAHRILTLDCLSLP
jgi:hypothetical protein